MLNPLFFCQMSLSGPCFHNFIFVALNETKKKWNHHMQSSPRRTHTQIPVIYVLQAVSLEVLKTALCNSGCCLYAPALQRHVWPSDGGRRSGAAHSEARKVLLQGKKKTHWQYKCLELGGDVILFTRQIIHFSLSCSVYIRLTVIVRFILISVHTVVL